MVRLAPVGLAPVRLAPVRLAPVRLAPVRLAPVRLATLFALLAGPVSACQIALVLALDVSASVDAREYALQRDGVAAALASDPVQSMLFAGAGEVAIAVYEWSGRNQQVMVVDWTRLTGPAALAGVVAQLRGTERSFDEFPTAIGYALGYGSVLFDRGPDCARRTLDVSGDGVTNDGFGPDSAYRAFAFQGVTVNGLVVGTDDDTVPIYYSTEVIRGPGAFVELADGYEDYARAMERKLMRELGALAIGRGPESGTESNG